MTKTASRRAWRSVFAILFILALAGVALHMRRVRELRAYTPPVSHPWALRSAVVQRGDLIRGFPVLATLSTSTSVTVTPQIAGVITQMGPREGQPVKAGDLLVKIDTTEMQNQLSSLRASLQAAQAQNTLQGKELARQRALLPKGFATQEQVDRLDAAVQSARADINQLKGQIRALQTRLAYGVITARANGRIAQRLQEPGDLASPGKAIYQLTVDRGAKVRVTVPQNILTQLHPGSVIAMTAGGRRERAVISRVFPALDPLSMGSAEADMDHIPFGLPSGARVPSRVVLQDYDNALVVPRAALISTPDPDRAEVLLLEPQKDQPYATVRTVPVQIVGRTDAGIAVTGAIKAGARVALGDEQVLLRLKDGDPVDISLAGDLGQ